MIFNLIYLYTSLLMINSIESFKLPLTNSSDNYKLEFLSVIFRHGDRTPEELYPNDPYKDYINVTNFGHLTLAGKARAYELGTKLRNFYNDFLGEMYEPHVIKARSTDYDRTKMSLMLVLSALYPPKGKQIWNPVLNWQPIPISYIPKKNDFLTPIKSCPLYIDELIKVENSDKIKLQTAKFHILMKNLTDWTGKTINSITDVLYLYHTLMSEYSMGFELPKWTNNIFPKGQLCEATIFRLQILNYNTKLRRLFSGILIKNIIDSMNGIVNGTIKDGRKIQLFSGHDTNIASLLIALDAFEPHVPEYSSAVIIELLKNINKQYYVRIRYYLGIPSEMKILKIQECDMNPCSLEKFINIMENIMPINDEAMCLH